MARSGRTGKDAKRPKEKKRKWSPSGEIREGQSEGRGTVRLWCTKGTREKGREESGGTVETGENESKGSESTGDSEKSRGHGREGRGKKTGERGRETDGSRGTKQGDHDHDAMAEWKVVQCGVSSNPGGNP